MVDKGQKYRKVGEDSVYEVLGPRKNPDREGDWFLGKVNGGPVEAVHERHLETGTEWTRVPDDAVDERDLESGSSWTPFPDDA